MMNDRDIWQTKFQPLSGFISRNRIRVKSRIVARERFVCVLAEV